VIIVIRITVRCTIVAIITPAMPSGHSRDGNSSPSQIFPQ
jgi:hypothetical protein